MGAKERREAGEGGGQTAFLLSLLLVLVVIGALLVPTFFSHDHRPQVEVNPQGQVEVQPQGQAQGQARPQGQAQVEGKGHARAQVQTPTKAQAQPELPPFQPLAKADFFQGAGVLVNDVYAFPVERAPMLRRDHFRWVALKVNDGLTLDGSNLARLDAWSRPYRALGISVCGWGVVHTQPQAEAQLAARLMRQYSLDCYIVDAEADYMGQGYGGDPGRSGVFTQAFRVAAPDAIAAVTAMGAAHKPWVFPFDYGAWARADFALLPQAYLSISTDYCVQCVFDNSARSGFPVSRTYPMIGVGWSQGRPKMSGADYAPLLKAAGVKGFSLFLGETSSEKDFDALGQAIEQDGVAAG